MTEAEWLASDEPDSMVWALHATGRERKFRRKFLLFTCACFLRGRKPHPDVVRAKEILERAADGQADAAEVARVRSKLQRPRGPAAPLFANGIGITTGFWADEFGQYHAAWQTASAVAREAIHRKPGRPSRAASAERERTRVEVRALVRCVFGNPFRPVAFAPEWRTDTVVALARQMYEARDFSAMPILADALQDAGCDNDAILDHCRGKQEGVSGEPAGSSPVQTAPHVRGCWVVDLVLGKE
jgi:hypothetical protein